MFLRLLAPRRTAILVAVWLIFFASLVCATVLLPFKPNLVFYLLPTRAWELMLGGIVALGRLPKLTGRAGTTICLIGLAMIVVPMLVYTSSTPFPGLTALPPTAGTAVLIHNGSKNAVSKALSSRVLVLVGRASYSIYLWHFPLIAFARYLFVGQIPSAVALCLCVASVALGFASLTLIEKPFRTGGRRRVPKVVLACLAMAIAAASSGAIVATHGLPSRLSSYDAAIASAAGDKSRHHVECMTLDKSIVMPTNACHLGTPKIPPTILLWGDSHAMVTATALEQAAILNRGSFLFAADADCPPGIGFGISQRFEGSLTSQLSYRYCADYNAQMLRMALISPTIKTIVFSSRWTNWRIGEKANPSEPPADVRLQDGSGTANSLAGNKFKWEHGFMALVDRLTTAGKRVVIVGPVPEPRFDVPHQLHVERFGLVGASRPITAAEYRDRHRTVLQFFSTLDGKPGISFIWPYDALCAKEECPLVESGHVMFLDQDHLSVYGARKTSYLYDELFR